MFTIIFQLLSLKAFQPAHNIVRSNFTSDSLLHYFMHFFPSVDSTVNFSYFILFKFPSDMSFRIVFHSARDGLLFSYLTDLPAEISADERLASELHSNSYNSVSSPDLNQNFEQAQDPGWFHASTEEFHVSTDEFHVSTDESQSTWYNPPSVNFGRCIPVCTSRDMHFRFF